MRTTTKCFLAMLALRLFVGFAAPTATAAATTSPGVVTADDCVYVNPWDPYWDVNPDECVPSAS